MRSDMPQLRLSLSLFLGSTKRFVEGTKRARVASSGIPPRVNPCVSEISIKADLKLDYRASELLRDPSGRHLAELPRAGLLSCRKRREEKGGARRGESRRGALETFKVIPGVRLEADGPLGTPRCRGIDPPDSRVSINVAIARGFFESPRSTEREKSARFEAIAQIIANDGAMEQRGASRAIIAVPITESRKESEFSWVEFVGRRATCLASVASPEKERSEATLATTTTATKSDNKLDRFPSRDTTTLLSREDV